MIRVVTEKREMVCFIAGDGRRRGGAHMKPKPKLGIYNSYGFASKSVGFLQIT